MTRSKQLLNLFNSAGHTLSYKDVLRIDTGLAERSLQSMDERSGHFLPLNLKRSVFTHFTADNIDISDSTLDGKQTFHATQIACWQRGSGNDADLKHIFPSSNETLQVPCQMDRIIETTVIEGKSQPLYPKAVTLDVYKAPDIADQSSYDAFANELLFHLKRNKQEVPITWSAFHQSISSINPDLTIVGYMPIVQAPAHEIDTLNTVVQKCMYISDRLGQRHTVLTVDQALYFKLMDLKWSVPEYRERLVPRMGGLHIAMNFLKCIGDHMSGSGLYELWMECELLGPVAAQNVLAGKHYSRGMRAHKLTAQALWKILLPSFLLFVANKDVNHSQILNDIMNEQRDIASSLEQLQNTVFREYFLNFREETTNPNVLFWWSYLDLVSILLEFTKSEREGLWDLYLHSFRAMLPWFFRYDHTNYARWGSVYLADCHQLPSEVLEEFKQGNFVVKRSLGTFNQVDPDQSQEWLNATGKKGGGIVGITRTPSALSRWSLSYNLRSHVSFLTRTMYNVNPDDIITHKDASKSRKVLDSEFEESLVDAMKRFKVLDPSYESDQLINMITKDKATDLIRDSLLSSAHLGQIQLEGFASDRLIPNKETGTLNVPLHHVLKKNKPLTFESLYKVRVGSKAVDKRKILQADRNILQRVVIAYKAGREVDLGQILKHELLPVPISIADTSGSLKSGNKSVLQNEILKNVEVGERIQHESDSSALIIDGQALVQSLRTHGMKTFGDFADEFVSTVFRKGNNFSRIDVLFDRYRDQSIKSGTRNSRAKRHQPVRRIVENRDVPLPANFVTFLSLNENKKDLAALLSEEIILQAPIGKTVVTAGGFVDENTVKCNDGMLELSTLEATHEEADTRIVLHAIHCSQVSACTSIVILASDTDVLLLLISFFSEIDRHLWMIAGTFLKPKNIPVHVVVEKNFSSSELRKHLVAFHSLTGCDTTSYFYGISKKSSLCVFRDNYELLEGLGEGELTDQKIKECEKFICKLYNQEAETTDAVRNVLFGKSKSPENMPPTSDALCMHIKRAHYQALIWRQANICKPLLPCPTEMGWKLDDGCLVPILMNLDPIPKACLDLIVCNCTKGCRTERCGCKRANLQCMDLCKCNISNKEECRNNSY